MFKETGLKNERRWNKGEIENAGMPTGGRSLKDYERLLGFRKEDLEGERILDLGTGPEIKIHQQLSQAGIGADVISLSPDFLFRKHTKKLRKSYPDAKLLAGIGQELPLKNGSFEKVLCLNVIEFIHTKDDFIQCMLEIIRVLKKEGIAYIGTFETEIKKDTKETGNLHYNFLMENKIIRAMVDNGEIEVSNEIVPEQIKRTKYDKSARISFEAPIYRIVIKKIK